VPRAVDTGCRGGQGSPRAAVPRAVETGCRGDQGWPGLSYREQWRLAVEEAKALPGM
jgi:hypothetical protein